MGYLFAIASAMLFGLNGTVAKVVLGAGIDPAQLTLFRSLGTAALSAVALLILDRRAFRVTPRALAALAVLGIVGVFLVQFAYASAIALLPVGIALLIEYLAIPIVAVLSFLFFTEHVRARLWVAIGLVIAGLAVVAQIWDSTLSALGVAVAFGAAIALTVYLLLAERALRHTSTLAVLFWSMTFSAVAAAIVSRWWALDPVIFVTPVSMEGIFSSVRLPLLVPLLWTVVFGSFLPFVLAYLAIGRMRATRAGIVTSSEIVFAFITAWLWLGEQLSVTQVIGAAVVVAGVVLAQTSRGAPEAIIEREIARAH